MKETVDYLCEWEEFGGIYQCAKCGVRRKIPRERVCLDQEALVANHKIANQPYGLGDRIENWLSSHGITEDRYKEIKQKFGLPANCGCGKRKQWFNKVGAYLGISADTYGPNKETK